jgi:hypothetical protein
VSWVCQDGAWQLGPAVGQGAGAGPGGRSAGCVTAQPGPSFVCQNSVWVIPGSSPAVDGATGSTATETSGTTTGSGASSGATPGSTLPASAGSPAATCTEPAPAVGWTCQGGRWVAPGTAPSAPGTSGSGSTESTCVGTAPLSPSGERAACVDGRWVAP